MLNRYDERALFFKYLFQFFFLFSKILFWCGLDLQVIMQLQARCSPWKTDAATQYGRLHFQETVLRLSATADSPCLQDLLFNSLLPRVGPAASGPEPPATSIPPATVNAPPASAAASGAPAAAFLR